MDKSTFLVAIKINPLYILIFIIIFIIIVFSILNKRKK
ncbi:unknown [Clostridium sp. CAG:221]|nr:unknown [Clostridium sp. CAG:221]